MDCQSILEFFKMRGNFLTDQKHNWNMFLVRMPPTNVPFCGQTGHSNVRPLGPLLMSWTALHPLPQVKAA